MRNYDDPVYKDFRLKVLKRDKFKCKMPGCKNKKNLQRHRFKVACEKNIKKFTKT